MKIEYLEGSRDCPLIRIYDFDRLSVCQLQQTFQKLAQGDVSSIALDKLTGVEAIDGCTLTAQVGQHDAGILREKDNSLSFVCTLTRSAWDNLADLTEPFCLRDATGYQWLDTTSTISLLLSPSGNW